MKAKDFIKELQKYADFDRAVFSVRFFKTGPGEYGEGDEFIGTKVPETRKVCKQFQSLELPEIQKLLNNPIHEYRLGAAIILANKYKKADKPQKQKIFDMYLKNVKNSRINSWDIVDVTCEHIVGAHLLNTDREIIYELARSDNLWERRASIISTFVYIKQSDAGTTFDIAEILLLDKHDLIQKAVGWMLREVGKRVDEALLIDFLEKHARVMPRTMLRYSLEKLSPEQKQKYMLMRLR